jgi:hypothetical protein
MPVEWGPHGFPKTISQQALADALVVTCGNIAHAAVLLDYSKIHVIRLAAKYGLRDYARELRLAAGQPSTGRPATAVNDD